MEQVPGQRPSAGACCSGADALRDGGQPRSSPRGRSGWRPRRWRARSPRCGCCARATASRRCAAPASASCRACATRPARRARGPGHRAAAAAVPHLRRRRAVRARDGWAGECGRNGVYLHPTHNWFLSSGPRRRGDRPCPGRDRRGVPRDPRTRRGGLSVDDARRALVGRRPRRRTGRPRGRHGRQPQRAARRGDADHAAPGAPRRDRARALRAASGSRTGRVTVALPEGVEPSSETPLHRAVYALTDAGAVVHTHSHFATVLSTLVDELPAVHYATTAFGGRVRVAPYATFGSDELAESVAAALEGPARRAARQPRRGDDRRHGRDRRRPRDSARMAGVRLPTTRRWPAARHCSATSELEAVVEQSRRLRYARRGDVSEPDLRSARPPRVAAVGVFIVDVLGRPVESLPRGPDLASARGDPDHRCGHRGRHQRRPRAARRGRARGRRDRRGPDRRLPARRARARGDRGRASGAQARCADLRHDPPDPPQRRPPGLARPRRQRHARARRHAVAGAGAPAMRCTSAA